MKALDGENSSPQLEDTNTTATEAIEDANPTKETKETDKTNETEETDETDETVDVPVYTDDNEENAPEDSLDNDDIQGGLT